MLELEQLSQLTAVAEYGTLSAAAEALHISQPSLTRSMQKLENVLGVELFERKKNRIQLNEAGRLAVEEAGIVLSAAENMETRMAAYARSLRTITIGSCAPAPMWEVTPLLSQQYPEMTIAAEMNEPEKLVEGMENGTYQLIITDTPLEKPGVFCQEYVTEQLYVSLPPAHPLAKRDAVHLSDLAGQTMLLFSELGVWQRLHDEKMQNIRFIVQTERKAFSDLISASVLPSFTTNLTQRYGAPMNRVNVPILDPEATIRFYLCVSEPHRSLLDVVFMEKLPC